MRITLKSGRAVSLSELHQSGTYAGLLAGKPDARINQDVIEDLLGQASRYNVAGAEPQLLAPAQMETRLPSVACIAVLQSGELQRPGSEPYSSAVVVWFQDDFGPPIAAPVLEQIKELDWESIARDWIW